MTVLIAACLDSWDADGNGAGWLDLRTRQDKSWKKAIPQMLIVGTKI